MTVQRLIPGYPKSILAVDDDPVLRAFADAELSVSGAKVTTAEDGMKALEKIQAGEFDVVVLDLEMPNMNGFELLQQLRSIDRTRYLPVVILTSREDADTAVKAFEAGATAYAMKPVNWERLRQRVREVHEARLAS
jgi:two-component system, sensor histidine kinase